MINIDSSVYRQTPPARAGGARDIVCLLIISVRSDCFRFLRITKIVFHDEKLFRFRRRVTTSTRVSDAVRRNAIVARPRPDGGINLTRPRRGVWSRPRSSRRKSVSNYQRRVPTENARLPRSRSGRVTVRYRGAYRRCARGGRGLGASTRARTGDTVLSPTATANRKNAGTDARARARPPAFFCRATGDMGEPNRCRVRSTAKANAAGGRGLEPSGEIVLGSFGRAKPKDNKPPRDELGPGESTEHAERAARLIDRRGRRKQ